MNVDMRVREREVLKDANPSAFQEVQTVGKHMWGRLEVVAVKINDPVFLDSTQESEHTIYKLVTKADFFEIEHIWDFPLFCSLIEIN